MQTFFYNLSGGINKAESKTSLGLNTKKLYWSDSKNIEILQNSGIIRQKGNTLLFKLPIEEEIIGLHPMANGEDYDILIATSPGKLYLWGAKSETLTTLDKTVNGSARVNFVDFLDGVVVGSKKDELFYINNDDNYTIESCNLKDTFGSPVKANVIGIFAGRLWVGSGATLYYSALGKYNDFKTSGDAGYINNFYTDTNDITGLKPYKNYLAIYKENSVYLLSGSSNENFALTPFADKGTTSFSSVATVNNKQYFINQGIFSLEQAGLLSQIQLGEEISLNIKPEFDNFDRTRFNEIIILHYEARNQIWFFIPYKNDNYFHTILIYNYINQAWFKRVIPQDITTACLVNESIITADINGKVYQEDFGNTFDGVAIDFMWKSPFLAAGDSNIKKTIEEFYFVLDDTYDNNFNFSVYKNYDSTFKDDEDNIYSINSDNLIWDGNGVSSSLNTYWNNDDTSIYTIWAVGSDSMYKAEISESNYSVQLCIEGTKPNQNAAIIGLEFKEVILDE